MVNGRPFMRIVDDSVPVTVIPDLPVFLDAEPVSDDTPLTVVPDLPNQFEKEMAVRT